MKGLVKKILNLPRVRRFLLGKLMDTNDFKLLAFAQRGYLRDIGWFHALENIYLKDNRGDLIPKLSYPMIMLLNKVLSKEMKVLDFGTGFSTAYFAQKCEDVTVFEYSPFWNIIMSHRLPENVSWVLTESEKSDFINQKDLYHILLIDCKNSRKAEALSLGLKKIKSNGVIIVDDSEDMLESDLFNLIQSKGYKRLDYWGIYPEEFNNKCSTLFYKEDNIIRI
jgi:hypothetical protein